MTIKYLLITFLLAFNSLYAQNEAVDELKNVSIGLTHAPPLIVLKDNKPPDGMLVDFLNSIALIEDWNINWVTGSWSNVMELAENGEIDIMTYIAYSPQRAQIFNFSSERFVTGWGQVYTLGNESINNILDLENKSIAVVKDDIHAKRFANLCQEYSVNCNLKTANDYDDAFDLLVNNKVSAAVSGSTVGISYEKKFNVIRTPIMFNPSDALFASLKSKNNKTLETIDKYLIKWRNDPNSPYSKSQIKWMTALHDKPLPKWLLYLIVTILFLLLISLIIALLLRSQIKKHVQQHINHSNQLKQIINLVPHMIYVIDAKGEVVLVNEYASKHFGVEITSGFTKNSLLQNLPQYSKLFEEDSILIEDGKGLVSKELITADHENKEVVFNIFKVPFKTDFSSAVLTVGVDITSQKRFQKQIHYMALHDELTKLPNRQLLKANIIKSLKNKAKSKTHSAVLYIDLDFFKNINDSLGHAAGDKLLKIVCKRLKSIANKKDMVARIGGDEFILHMIEISNNESESVKIINKVAKKAIKVLSQKIFINHHELYISASIGVVNYPKDANDYDQIMQKADIAMYHAKSKGRNNFVVFENYMEKDTKERHALVTDLRKAIKNNEFFIEYQPQIFGNKQEVIGFEALIRWNHPSGEIIMPDKFIPAAEDSGLIVPIGNWVLKQVCNQLSIWIQSHTNLPFVTVNLSVLQIHNKNLVSYIQNLLNDFDVPAKLLELEVTESVMIKQIEKTSFTLSELKNLGVRLSIDDFGTGYSSLSYLKKLPFDKLKIDYSFVKDIISAKDTRTLVKTIIGMAEELGLEVIAEGVETIEQLEMLTDMGCHNFQGFYFDSPKPADFIEKNYLNIKPY